MGLLEPDFAEPYVNWQVSPSPENTDKLLHSVKPVITAALRTYGTSTSPTLQTRAKLMALDAMKRYDPTKSKLRTHLMFQLQGLRRHAAKETQILSVPEQVALDLGHVRTGENFLRDKFGRDPSDMELSDHLNMSRKRIGYIRQSRPTYSEGSAQRATGDGEDIFQPEVMQSPMSSAWLEFVYGDLAPIDQVIMEHTIGLHKKPVLANQSIARRLRISPGAVSQRKAKIQEKLNMHDELGVF